MPTAINLSYVQKLKLTSLVHGRGQQEVERLFDFGRFSIGVGVPVGAVVAVGVTVGVLVGVEVAVGVAVGVGVTVTVGER